MYHTLPQINCHLFLDGMLKLLFYAVNNIFWTLKMRPSGFLPVFSCTVLLKMFQPMTAHLWQCCQPLCILIGPKNMTVPEKVRWSLPKYNTYYIKICHSATTTNMQIHTTNIQEERASHHPPYRFLFAKYSTLYYIVISLRFFE